MGTYYIPFMFSELPGILFIFRREPCPVREVAVVVVGVVPPLDDVTREAELGREFRFSLVVLCILNKIKSHIE